MLKRFPCAIAVTLVALIAPRQPCAAAAETAVEDAWKAMPKYKYRQNMAALLTVAIK